jgi:hypothetical protein
MKDKRETIKIKKLIPEFYLNPDEAAKRYSELLKDNKEVFLQPLFQGKLWVITYDK